MSLRVRLAAEDYWGDLEGEALEGAKDVVGRVADKLVARVKQKLSRAYAGQPAAPDEPPLRRTGGELLDSVGRTPVETDGKRVVFCKVEVDHDGAARLEFGKIDKRGIRTFAHPYLRPAVEEMEVEAEATFKEWAAS